MTEQLGNTLDWQSASTAQFPALLRDELHLWWLPLSLTSAQAEHAHALLSDIQRDKYQRRMPSNIHEAYLAGRYYLLNLLGAYVGCAPDKVLLSYSRLNKPSLSHHEQDLEFNFTDTRISDNTHGLFAFCRRRPVGVDLEARSRDVAVSKIVQKRFSPAEIDYVSDDHGQIIMEKFLAIWTRKEAYGKAKGVGINFKMREHDLAQPDSFELDFFDEDDQAWRLIQIELGSELISSVVHEGHQSLSLRAFNSLNIVP